MSDTIGQSGLADRLIADMRNRWQAGDKVLTESYVEQHAELRTNDSLLSQLILAEFQLAVIPESSPIRPDTSNAFRKVRIGC